MNYQVNKTSFISNLDVSTNSKYCENTKLIFANKFDRIMIRMPLELMESYNSNLYFSRSTPSGIIMDYTYDSKKINGSKYLLWIKIDISNSILVINVSAKCLLYDYPDSISYQNIDKVFKAINDTGIVVFDNVKALVQAELLSCDVVKDLTEIITSKERMAYKLCIKSKYWRSEDCIGGILFRKITAKGRHVGASYTIYDKEIDMKNRRDEFCSILDEPNILLKRFQGIIRHELKLNSISLIKRNFKMNNVQLIEVLRCNTDVIEQIKANIFDLEQFSKFFNAITLSAKYTKGKSSIIAFKNELFCKHCEYNPEIIRFNLQNLLGEKTNLSSAMKPFLQIIAMRKNDNSLF